MRDRWSSLHLLTPLGRGGRHDLAVVAGEASARGGCAALSDLDHARPERVPDPVRATDVHRRQRPAHQELRQGQEVADGQPVGDELAAHEVRRVAAQKYESEVPGEEEDRRRHDERPLTPGQLLKLWRPLDGVPVGIWPVFGHAVPLPNRLWRGYPVHARLMRKITIPRRKRDERGSRGSSRKPSAATSWCRPRTCRSAGATLPASRCPRPRTSSATRSPRCARGRCCRSWSPSAWRRPSYT